MMAEEYVTDDGLKEIFDTFNSSIDIFKVLTLIDLLRKDKEIFLNSSQSLNLEYLSMNFGLNSISCELNDLAAIPKEI